MRLRLSVLFCWLISSIASADTVVLIHGFLGDAFSFERGGITHTLQKSGWQRGGIIQARSRHNVSLALRNTQATHRFIAVSLPSLKPMVFQAQMLDVAIGHIEKLYPREPIHLVAHSAGGVVARLLLVQKYRPQIVSLITIASPHMGTRRAEFASDMADLPFPMNMMAETFGGPIYDEFQSARQLFSELSRPRPGNFLHWLNRQPHPPITYVSVIHRKRNFFNKDFMVPAKSQNMNQVPALAGKSEVARLASGHRLGWRDGQVLAYALAILRNKK